MLNVAFSLTEYLIGQAIHMLDITPPMFLSRFCCGSERFPAIFILRREETWLSKTHGDEVHFAQCETDNSRYKGEHKDTS